MRSHPGNPVTPPTQLAPLPSFHLAPSECAHPLNPHPSRVDRERALRGAESRKTRSGASYSAAARGRHTRHKQQEQQSWRKCLWT